MPHEWRFPAELLSNYDGDTLKLRLDLGFQTSQVHDVRLHGVDTPEIRGGTEATKQLARLARDRASEFIKGGKEVYFLSEKWAGKYGRSIGDVEVDGVSLRQWLIDNRLGVAYDGGPRVPIQWLHRENAKALGLEG